MFKKIVGVGVFIGLISFFASYIANLAFGIGVIAGFLGVGFNLLTYLGASCSLATKLVLTLNSFFLILIISKIYGYFKDT